VPRSGAVALKNKELLEKNKVIVETKTVRKKKGEVKHNR
jgi:hypothetical protein